MNCEGYRDRLIDALASGKSSPAGDVAAHMRACVECKRFYGAQVNLFGAIDSGVRAMVNETVPASLLPRVRVRMEENHAARPIWEPAWRVAACAAVVGAISIGFVLRPISGPIARPPVVPVAVQVAAESAPVLPTIGKTEHVIIKHRKNGTRGVGSPLEPSSASPEVMVLDEERAAYERYVKVVRIGTGYPAAKAKLLDPIEIAPEEIAQLQIKKLELNSLVEESEE
jgi:hypothetical protein